VAEPGAAPLIQFRSVEEVLSGLRQHGARVTSARRLLLGVLFDDRRHRSAEDLARDVRARAPDVNISTIYRNLDELVRLGVVDRSRAAARAAAYHLASAAAHGHLVCERCGAVTEVPSQLFRDLTETLAGRYGFAVTTHMVTVTGRCAACQRRDGG
jgi:Fur family transcriptional regulator, ferric uptake regulator